MGLGAMLGDGRGAPAPRLPRAGLGFLACPALLPLCVHHMVFNSFPIGRKVSKLCNPPSPRAVCGQNLTPLPINHKIFVWVAAGEIFKASSWAPPMPEQHDFTSANVIQIRLLRAYRALAFETSTIDHPNHPSTRRFVRTFGAGGGASGLGGIQPQTRAPAAHLDQL